MAFMVMLQRRLLQTPPPDQPTSIDVNLENIFNQKVPPNIKLPI
jgi:hypothetical protein